MPTKKKSEIANFCDGIEDMIIDIKEMRPDIPVMRMTTSTFFEGAAENFLEAVNAEMIKREYSSKIENLGKKDEALVIDISKFGMN